MTDETRTTVGFAASDLGGGLGYYRARVPARMLQEAGRDAVVGGNVEMDLGGGPISILEVDDYPGTGVLTPWPEPRAFAPHCLVLAGSFPHHLRAGAIRAAQAAGQAIVVDIDDALTLPDWHPHKSLEIEKLRREAIAAADIVTVGTEILAREVEQYAQRPPVIVRNALDLADAHRALGKTRPIAPVEDQLVVGYRGPLEFHRGDLAQVGNALEWLHRRRPYVKFIHIGADDPAPFAAVVGVPVEAVHARPLVGFDRYLESLADIDVAILPYSSTTYSRAKGAQGALEWSAAGVAWVASEQPSLLELSTDLAGALRWPAAHSGAEWLRMLEELADRPAQRVALWALQMRACAPRYFGVEQWLREELEIPRERITNDWLTAIDQALLMRQPRA